MLKRIWQKLKPIKWTDQETLLTILQSRNGNQHRGEGLTVQDLQKLKKHDNFPLPKG